MIIELVGGPLDGVIHEVQKGFDVPDQFGLPNEEKTEHYWYRTDSTRDEATYQYTERLKEARNG